MAVVADLIMIMIMVMVILFISIVPFILVNNKLCKCINITLLK